VQSVVPLPIRDTDLDEVAAAPDDGDLDASLSPLDKIARLAGSQGNIVDIIPRDELVKLGNTVVDDYEKDCADRKEWEDIALEALDSAAQDKPVEVKTHPWPNASNINIPLLTTASLQFNARMYPAVVKGDEAILCKVVGQDNGKPRMAPNPMTGQIQPVPQLAPGPDGQPQPVMGPDGKMLPEWEVPPGAKSARARRVSEFMNTTMFYRMKGWEDDTDALLMQLPTVGCVFRKVWFDKYKGVQSMMLPALNLLVPKKTRDLESAPRITEKICDVFPHEIRKHLNTGYYKVIKAEESDDPLAMDEEGEDSGARLLLEQHRWIDLDDDGVDEPYILTVDHSTRTVLRLEANFAMEDIKADEQGKVYCIERRDYYVKYGMFPHPKGEFYDIGLGHLLKKLGATIDTALNQLMDAGTAQTAGGGFIGAGVRLQGRGNRGVVRMTPGEYRVVDVSGDSLRNGIFERTLPNVSPVTFQVLDFILGFAREISGVKDVLTGEAPNQAPVGSTLALIEQGLQVFNATAKRFFRSAKAEYTLIYDNLRLYGGEAAAKDYVNILDEAADFNADFNAKDLDIRPVSDPSTVTRMQKVAKAQVIQGTIPILAQVGGDPREAIRRVYEAADIEDIDKLLPPPQPPPPPDPMQQKAMSVQIAKTESEGLKNVAAAKKLQAETEKVEVDAAKSGIEGQQEQYNLTKEATVDGMSAAALDNGIPT
jgi:chaperonin GroES